MTCGKDIKGVIKNKSNRQKKEIEEKCSHSNFLYYSNKN